MKGEPDHFYPGETGVAVDSLSQQGCLLMPLAFKECSCKGGHSSCHLKLHFLTFVS